MRFFSITFILLSAHHRYLRAALALCRTAPHQDRTKGSTAPSYPNETEVVSQNIFNRVFKHLLMFATNTRFTPKDRGKEIQPGRRGCLRQQLSLRTLILNKGDGNKSISSHLATTTTTSMVMRIPRFIQTPALGNYSNSSPVVVEAVECIKCSAVVWRWRDGKSKPCNT